MEQLQSDVVKLVVAARTVQDECGSPESLRALAQAAEAFADRVPWEDAPDDDEWKPIATAPTDGTVIYAKNDVMQYDVKAKFIQNYQCVINGEKIGKPQPAWVVEHDYREKYMPLLPGTFMSPTMWKPI